MPLFLTRVRGFRARHHFGRAGESPTTNRARYGPLAEPHQHDYRCSVTVTGPLDPANGMLMDLALLDRILDEEVGRLDGGDLNHDLPPVAVGGQQPTCEALATWLFDRVAARLPAGVALARLRIAEDDTLHAERTATG